MLYNLNEEYIAKCFKLKNIQTDQWKQSKFLGITINYLFICSRNQWRSPEWYCHAREGTIFAVGFGIHTRSAGTSKQAKHQVSAKDIVWADLIAVMEYKHKQALQEKFSKQLKHKTVIV